MTERKSGDFKTQSLGLNIHPPPGQLSLDAEAAASASVKLGISRQVNGFTELFYRELGWTKVDLIEEALMTLPIQTRTKAVRHLNDLQDDDLAAELNYSLPSELLAEILNL